MSEKQTDYELTVGGLQPGELRLPKGKFDPESSERGGGSAGQVFVLPVPRSHGRASAYKRFILSGGDIVGADLFSDDEDSDSSADEQMAEIRAALNESRELGQRVSQRIDALIERSG